MDCDIIIPVWNQQKFTEDCVESIFRNTRDVDYRLIIIDNASDLPTREYLEKLEALSKPVVKVIRNDVNVGFIKAVNRGMELSRASYVCLLNNDTIAYDGWLKTMIEIAHKHREIGLVNPSSNNLGQRPSEGEPPELYAHRLKKEHDRWVELGAAIGFCMLIKREVIDRIGYLDEDYGMGNFEDTDYSRRAVKEGYVCARACGAYVHHRENGSFRLIKTFNEDFERNRKIFETRWGKPRRVAYVVEEPAASELASIAASSIALARSGSWVFCFMKEPVILPEHSNIIRRELGPAHYHAAAAWGILKKKKKFDEIYVGDEKFGRIMDALKFIHKAEVKYY